MTKVETIGAYSKSILSLKETMGLCGLTPQGSRKHNVSTLNSNAKFLVE